MEEVWLSHNHNLSAHMHYKRSTSPNARRNAAALENDFFEKRAHRHGESHQKKQIEIHVHKVLDYRPPVSTRAHTRTCTHTHTHTHTHEACHRTAPWTLTGYGVIVLRNSLSLPPSLSHAHMHPKHAPNTRTQNHTHCVAQERIKSMKTHVQTQTQTHTQTHTHKHTHTHTHTW